MLQLSLVLSAFVFWGFVLLFQIFLSFYLLFLFQNFFSQFENKLIGSGPHPVQTSMALWSAISLSSISSITNFERVSLLILQILQTLFLPHFLSLSLPFLSLSLLPILLPSWLYIYIICSRHDIKGLSLSHPIFSFYLCALNAIYFIALNIPSVSFGLSFFMSRLIFFGGRRVGIGTRELEARRAYKCVLGREKQEPNSWLLILL